MDFAEPREALDLVAGNPMVSAKFCSYLCPLTGKCDMQGEQFCLGSEAFMGKWPAKTTDHSMQSIHPSIENTVHAGICSNICRLQLLTNYGEIHGSSLGHTWTRGVTWAKLNE